MKVGVLVVAVAVLLVSGCSNPMKERYDREMGLMVTTRDCTVLKRGHAAAMASIEKAKAEDDQSWRYNWIKLAAAYEERMRQCGCQ